MDDGVLQVGRPLPRIAKATPLDGLMAEITWSDGRTEVIDLSPALLSHRHFVALRNDEALFNSMQVSPFADSLQWANGAELSAVWIESLCDPEFDNQAFRRAMETLGLSLDGMAARLGIARRLVADYRKDKPIPTAIALATLYLVEHRGGVQ